MQTGLAVSTVALVLGLSLSGCGGTVTTTLDNSPTTGAGGTPTAVARASEYGINGGLDCQTRGRFEGSMAIPEGAEGAATPEEALRATLEGYANDAPDGRVVIVGDREASVVADGREVVTTRATEYDGGWFALEVSGCNDGWRGRPPGSSPSPQ